MRLTTLLRRLLGVTQMYVKQVEMAADGPLTVSVEPAWRRSRCGTCGKRAPRYDRQPVREWRHLSWGRMPAWLRYAPWRVSCRRCRGVKVEQVPWASGSSVFTSGFEELAAYLAQVTDRTAVSRLLGISWVTVGSIVERIVARRLDGARFAKLRRIGVDEFSYRKRHRYLTIVVDHDERRVVWAGRGRSAETLGAFFEQLGPGGCARIELVTPDTIPQSVLFPDLFDKPLVATFNQEHASSDGGAVLLKAAERVYGLVKAFAREDSARSRT